MPNEIRIVFSDIDGTLLPDDKEPTPRTVRAVQGLRLRGIPFVPVSARMPEAIYPITDPWGDRLPVISYSGALVLTEGEEVLLDSRMERAATAAVLAAIGQERLPVTLNYYAGRHWYVKNVDQRVQYEMDITGAVAEAEDFEALMEGGEQASKILVMGEPGDCGHLQRTLAAAFPGLNVVLSAPFLLEIMDASVSKAGGIDVMLAHYGFRPEEALAFGDNYNDVEMLANIPHSIAMGNAPEEVKRCASRVTDTNNEDGLAKYLEGLGLA